MKTYPSAIYKPNIHVPYLLTDTDLYFAYRELKLLDYRIITNDQRDCLIILEQELVKRTLH